MMTNLKRIAGDGSPCDPTDVAALTDPITWPAPEPVYMFAQYSYSCTCKICGESEWSDKGILGPERAYRRHYWRRHAITADVA